MRMIMMFLAWLMVSITYAQQNVTVRSVQANDADLDNYKTFTWASHVRNQNDNGRFCANDMSLKQGIRDAVQHELEARGYKMVEEGGDLIVNFRVFEEPVSLTGYDAYGEGYWGTGEVASTAGRVATNTQPIDVEAGTLIISLLDRAEGQLVWQGFASGLIDQHSAASIGREMDQASQQQTSGQSSDVTTQDTYTDRDANEAETEVRVSTDRDTHVRVETESSETGVTSDDQTSTQNDQMSATGTSSVARFDKDMSKIKQAVHLIFEEYGHNAADFRRR
jgi:hypothetical protein